MQQQQRQPAREEGRCALTADTYMPSGRPAASRPDRELAVARPCAEAGVGCGVGAIVQSVGPPRTACPVRRSPSTKVEI